MTSNKTETFGLHRNRRQTRDSKMSENENSKSKGKRLEENRQKIRIEQYIRCCADIRHFDNGVWQIASINITIAGIMIGVSFQFLSGCWRAIPLFIAFCLSLALTVTMSKYLYFKGVGEENPGACPGR
jgi:hypothetical protein